MNFKVGDTFVFNGKVPEWYSRRMNNIECELNFTPWKIYKNSDVIRIVAIDHEIHGGGYKCPLGLWFYKDQMNPRYKLRRKVK